VLDLLLDLGGQLGAGGRRRAIDRLVLVRRDATDRRVGDHWLAAARFARVALEFEALSDRVVAPGVNHAEREEGSCRGEQAGKGDYGASSQPARRGGHGHVTRSLRRTRA